MKLHSKFDSLDSKKVINEDIYNHDSKKCVEIADEYAIGFALWFRDYQWTGNKETINQLLEIYKIEKGL